MKSLSLIAVGPDGDRREWALQRAVEYGVGRDPGQMMEHAISVEGDRHLSRFHFSVKAGQETLWVERSPKARNPLYFDGQEQDAFVLNPGQVFYTGKTQFGVLLGTGHSATTTHFTLVHKAKEQARLRRLEDCFTAVLSLLSELRQQGNTSAWQVAFPVIRSILPEVRQISFLQVHPGSSAYRVVDSDPAEMDVELEDSLIEEACDTGETVTAISQDIDLNQASETTLGIQSSWLIASPVRGLEQSRFLICVSGRGSLEAETLEERATLIDLIGEMVGHHIVIRQGSEYSSLLGVFGHHVGTLFKTSGALQLWSNPGTSEDVKRVLNHLLPIWGISQAISLHKKRGEKAHQALLESWVKNDQIELEALELSLLSILSHVYYSLPEEPFLPWRVNGKEIPKIPKLVTLPPLDDVEHLFDKTLALGVGLLEVLHNVRKYPSLRGSGREDRRDLAKLSEQDRIVHIKLSVEGGQANIEIDQPVVTASDGSIPRSRSLERIRALEQSLLGALVGTEAATVGEQTEVDFVVRMRQRWSYRYGQLLADWREYHGAST